MSSSNRTIATSTPVAEPASSTLTIHDLIFAAKKRAQETEITARWKAGIVASLRGQLPYCLGESADRLEMQLEPAIDAGYEAKAEAKKAQDELDALLQLAANNTSVDELNANTNLQYKK